MSFRFLPKSVISNDLELRNSNNVCVISPNAVSFGTDYVMTVIEIHPHRYFLQQKCRPKNQVFSKLLTAILAGDYP